MDIATDDDYFGRVEGATMEYYLNNSSSGFTIQGWLYYSMPAVLSNAGLTLELWPYY